MSEYEILLATYNGSRYIIEQLESIACQTLLPVRILLSDDGSIDNTVALVEAWSIQHNIPIDFLQRDSGRLGSCKNFERLLSRSTAPYIMFSDQDDIWHPYKAERYIEEMHLVESRFTPDVPIIIHSDLQLIDHVGGHIHDSFFTYQGLTPHRNDTFSIAMQNIVTGCACMVNRSAIRYSLPFPSHTVLHDWWLALTASYFGHITYISFPYVSYRQHDHNVVGAQSIYQLFLQRIIGLLTLSIDIDSLIGPSLRQLYYFNMRFPYPNDSINISVKCLFSKNPYVRFLSAYSLGLSKSGLLRTISFYVLLLLWKPSLQT